MLYLDCASVLSAYVGEAEARVRSVFREARQHRPSLIFFDEVDAIAKARKGGSDARLLSCLLAEMDGVGGANGGVCFVGATNVMSLIDSALLRPGRFDVVCEVPRPDGPGRIDILRKYLTSASILPKVDLDDPRLVTSTEGFSGAEVVAGVQRLACVVAANQAVPEETTTTTGGVQEFGAGEEEETAAMRRVLASTVTTETVIQCLKDIKSSTAY